MSFYRLILIGAGILLACASGAAAQTLPGWIAKSFTFDRIDADNVILVNEVEIEGEAGTANAGQKFFADRIEMNIKTGELIAKGNVVFSTPTARIAADNIVFNTKTKLGTFNTAYGIASLGERGQQNRSMFGALEPDVYFYGDTIEKIGPDKYRIHKGGFTTCVQPTPRWEIVSGNATVNLDDYVILRNAVVHVKDVPVFYLPLLYYPIQEDDRATGFLLPQYGSSLAMGNSISNAFFWAINRSQDATFFHDWMFSRGHGLGTEYRYVMGPQAQGNLRYYWLDEKQAVLNNGQTRHPRRSKSIQGGLSQNLPFGLSARARVDYVTDVTVRQTYSYDFFQASQSTRTIDGGISGSWRNLSVNALFQRNEIFYNDDQSILSGRAPGFTAAMSGVRLWRLPIFASVNAEAGQFLQVQRSGATSVDSGLNKVDFAPSIRAPLSTLPFLQVNATAAYRTTYFSESLSAADTQMQVEEPITRNYGDMRVEVVGPIFSRVFNPQNAIADRMKHIIEPNFSVQRRTHIASQDRIPRTIGAYDTIIGGTTQMNYGITNRVMVRKEVEGQPAAGAPREMLNLSIRQTYYTDSAASQFDTSYTYGSVYRRPSAFSPISLNARAMPTMPLAVDLRVEYEPAPQDADDPRIIGMSLNGTWRSDRADVTGGWTRQAYPSATGVVPPSNLMNSSANLRFSDGKYGGNVTFNYDLQRSQMLNQKYVAFYNAQCCGVSFEFQSFSYPRDFSRFLIPSDRRFNISFTLAGVGSFSNLLGTFGGGTY
ncbi:MAG TPA: putative LPS assembly protein LptD [Vicinamibacterales bacterium]|nr:putative LPS assembly protein LptD [Vicinamibacterales bacterium]